MKNLLRLLCLSFALLSSLYAADIPAMSTTVAVGDKAPVVVFRDLDGHAVALRDLIATKPTVIVFYRGSWCPFCMRHLAALGEIQDKIIAAGFQLVAVSADQPSVLARTPHREQYTYTLLSDSTMEAAAAFGITFRVPDEVVGKYKTDYHVDLEAASGRNHHLLPHPAVFIIDRSGIVRFVHVNPDYKVRLGTDELLQALQRTQESREM